LREAATYAIGTLAACSWPANRDVRTADPSADGCRSAAILSAIGGRHIVSPAAGRQLVVTEVGRLSNLGVWTLVEVACVALCLGVAVAHVRRAVAYVAL